MSNGNGKALAKKLLNNVGGYVATPRGSKPPAQDRPPKMGVVDPAYAGGNSAKVTFDGETSMSAKAYVIIGILPASSDRVVLFPVGKTYVIAGNLSGGSAALMARLVALEKGAEYLLVKPTNLVNCALASSGLGEITFTAQTSFDFEFASALADNYKLEFRFTSAAAATLVYAQAKATGTGGAVTATGYTPQVVQVGTGAAALSSVSEATTQVVIGRSDTTGGDHEVRVKGLFLGERTGFVVDGADAAVRQISGGRLTNTTSYPALRILADSAITGRLRIFRQNLG